jgi:hypothetical protein
MTDLLRTQLLRVWRSCQESVDLFFCEEAHRLARGMFNDVDILTGVYAHMRRHYGEDGMAATAKIGDGDGLPL